MLSPEETEAALTKARKDKAHKLAVQEYKEKVTAGRRLLTMNWQELAKFVSKKADLLIPDYTVNKTLRTENKLILDEYNGKIFQQLLYYFSKDEQLFEGDLSKGLFLQGGVGAGKTLFMKIFMENPLLSYGLVSCRKVSDKYSDEGEEGVQRNNETFGDGIKKYNGMIKLASNGDPFGHQQAGWCFDDMGTETVPAKHFGRDKNVMSDIILNRYDNQLDFNTTHITTNLNTKEVEQKYGSRAFDRIGQMFNIVQFPKQPSRRVNH